MWIFNAVKKQSDIFIYFAYLYSLYTVVELHKNFVSLCCDKMKKVYITETNIKTTSKLSFVSDTVMSDKNEQNPMIFKPKG